MSQRPTKRTVVAASKPIKGRDPARLRMRRGTGSIWEGPPAPEKSRAQHRGDRQRNDKRDRHGDRERYRKFAKDSPDKAVNPTSREPASAASTRVRPSSRCRAMFSSTTIASSTTNPVEIVSAISDRLSRL